MRPAAGYRPDTRHCALSCPAGLPCTGRLPAAHRTDALGGAAGPPARDPPALKILMYMAFRGPLVRALCMVTVGPGMVDQAAASLRRKRGPVKDILVVTGRADICILLQGSIDEINSMIIDFKRITGIVTTETMIEVEVNMGW